MIEGVKQHKWWGWGEDGHSYHHDDKPKFAPFVKKLVGVDINAPIAPLPKLSDLNVPPSRLEPELRDALTGISGAEYVQSDDETRVVHGLGKGVRDLMRVRAGEFGRLPDVVVYPANEDEVARIVDAVVAANAVVIPFGGGSNIVAALEAEPGEQRQVAGAQQPVHHADM